MSLYLEKYKHNEELTLADFLYLFLTVLNRELATYTAVDNKLQCYRGKNRSLGDIHQICKTYYPEVTREKVKETLLNFGKDLVGDYCTDIRRRVYLHKHLHLGWGQGNYYNRDEYGDLISYRSENLNILNDTLIKQIKEEIKNYE